MIIDVIDIFTQLGLCVDKIHGHSDHWETIKSYVDRLNGEDITLVFKSVGISQPYLSPVFNELIRYPNVKIDIYYDLKTYKEIVGYLQLQDLPLDKVRHFENVKHKNKPDYSEKFVEWFKEMSSVDEHEDYIDISTKSNGVASYSAKGIFKAYGKMLEDTKEKYGGKRIRKVSFNFENSVVVDTAIELFDLILDLKKSGVEMECTNCSEMSLFERYAETKDTKVVTLKDREDYFNNMLKMNQVVIMEHKPKTRRKNFLKESLSDPISVRVAIYKGWCTVDNIKCLKFVTYFVDTFTTMEDYKLKMLEKECDEEEHILKTEDALVRPVDIASFVHGDGYSFLGDNYTIYRCIQNDAESYQNIYVVGKDRKIYNVKCALPQLIKDVFKEFDVEYNEEELEKDIKDTTVPLIVVNNN